MVVNTGICSYSEMKIWPGRGSRFVARDGKIHFFIGSKVRSLFRQKIKPIKLTWTQTWRRMNKKGKAEAVKKRRVKRQVRVQKAIVGASLADIEKRRNERPEYRQQLREQAVREIKDRQKKKSQQVQKFEKQAKAQAKVPKSKGGKRK